MNILKSTLESFKENELSKKHKLHVYGGLTDGGDVSLPNDDSTDPTGDDSDPKNGTGPRGGSTGGSSSATSAASLGNPYAGSLPIIGG